VPGRRAKRIPINVHKNPDIQVLWDIDAQVCKTCTIQSRVVDMWYDNLVLVDAFMCEEKRRPSPTAKDKKEKTLGGWIGTQQKNAKADENGVYKHAMRDDDKREKWEALKEKYKEYFISIDDIWYAQCEEVDAFICEEKRRPSPTAKDKKEKTLGKWMSHQQTNAKAYENGIYKDAMKDEDKREKWEALKEKYAEYFVSPARKKSRKK
jgi:hypothetical protein